MTYAAIITQVQCDSDAAPRLACAVDMAERFGARLIGVGAEMMPPLAFDGGYVGIEAQWFTAMREIIDDRLQRAGQIFRDTARDLGAQAVWSSGIEMPAPAIAAASRAADIVVAGGLPHGDDGYRVASAAELALTSGRPVLVVPSHGRALSAERIVLAWKDTREARRALSDALPFLEAAEAVEVAAVCPGHEAEESKRAVEDVAAALVRRAVKAETKLVIQPRPHGGHILDEARRFGADLIVAGAYGHSRLGEWVFGGVTQDLLGQDEAYLLFSH